MERQRFLIEEALFQIVSAAGALSGQAYLEKVVELVVETWQVAAAFVIEVDRHEPSRATLRSFAGRDAGQGVGDAPFTGSPWLSSWKPELHYRPAAAGRPGVDDPMLREAGIEAYLAIPLIAHDGLCVGYVGVLDDHEMPAGAAAEAEAFLGLLAQRISIEVDRAQETHELQRELEAMRWFADESGDCLIRWTDRCLTSDPQPHIEFVSAGIERLTGYTPEEISADPLVVLADILPRVAREMSEPNVTPAANATALIVRRDTQPTRVSVRRTRFVVMPDGDLHEHECIVGEPPITLALGGPLWIRQLCDALDAVSIGGICVQGGRVACVNVRARVMTARRDDDILDLELAGEGSPESRTTLGEWVKRVARARAGRTVMRVVGRRARERDIEFVSHGIDVGGQRVQLLTMVDVTDQVQVAREAQHLAEFNRDVFAALPAYIAVIDRGGTIVAANDAWDQGVGRSVGEPLRAHVGVGGNLLQAARYGMEQGTPGAGDFLAGAGAVLSGTLTEFTYQVRLPLADGQFRWLLITLTPLAHNDGAVITGHNITALKEEQRTIADTAIRERTILTNLPDQLAKVSSDGRIAELFPPTQKAHVMPLLPPNSVGRNIRDVIRGPEGEAMLQSLKDAARGDRVVITKISIMNDDVERQYETRVVPFAPNELLLVARDRTAEQWPATQPRGANGGQTDQRTRIAHANPYGLTFREASVLQLMVRGAADKEIASQLGVSVFTVNKHVSKILHKMDAPSRTEASTRTLREGLLD